MLATSPLLLILPFFQAILGTPISIGSILGGLGTTTSSGTPTSLSQDTVNANFLRPAQFSRVAYCSTGAVTNWQCGGPCSDMGNDIEVLQAGGGMFFSSLSDGDDGIDILHLCQTAVVSPVRTTTFVDFIAHDPSTQSIVVAHEGTDPHSLLSILNDVEFPLVSLNSSRFPSANGENVQVHDGFQQTFERTADSILAGVQNGLASKGVSKVLVTGHSQGAAIAMMDAVMLRQDLDPSVEITTTVFGLPRGGNPAWADFIDTTLGTTMAHMTNQDDPVPLVPPQLIGYQHPSGEVHIRAVDANGDATDVVACPGQENENCSDGNSFLESSVQNHLGPYLENVSFGSAACSL